VLRVRNRTGNGRDEFDSPTSISGMNASASRIPLSKFGFIIPPRRALCGLLAARRRRSPRPEVSCAMSGVRLHGTCDRANTPPSEARIRGHIRTSPSTVWGVRGEAPNFDRNTLDPGFPFCLPGFEQYSAIASIATNVFDSAWPESLTSTMKSGRCPFPAGVDGKLGGGFCAILGNSTVPPSFLRHSFAPTSRQLFLVNAMLRITVQEESATWRLNLSGKLAGCVPQ
jgi:hypothetical protein